MKKYLIIGIASLSMLFTSCLKDKKVEDRKYGMNGVEDGKIIELADDNDHIITYALDFKNLDTAFNIFEVRLAADLPAPEDITVVLSLDNSLTILDDYNAENGTSLVQFPLNLYQLPNGLTVTIPAGKRSAFVRLNTNTINFNPSLTYALGFRIATVNKTGYTISGNFGNLIVSFAAKNQYDGIYSVVSGWVQRYTGPGTPEAPGGLNGSLTGNADVIMSTVGAYSCSIPPSAPPAPGRLLWAFGSASAVAGIDGLTVTVNPTTNLVTMASATNASLANWAGHTNNYVPATKTFNIAMKWTSTAPAYREYEIVLKYKGPR